MNYFQYHKHITDLNHNIQIRKDIHEYGAYYEVACKFNWITKLIRWFKYLPLDRRRLDPTKVKFSRPEPTIKKDGSLEWKKFSKN